MHRILLIQSYNRPDGVSDTELHERIITRNPRLAKFEFTSLGIEKIIKSLDLDITRDYSWDFDKQLELLCIEFKPDYIMVHTGSAFEKNPSLVIRSLINVSKGLPNVKIGFQDGKDMAVKIGLSGGGLGSHRNREGIGNIALSSLENDTAFQETDELKEIIKEVYFPQ